jgi:hypothetical protein
MALSKATDSHLNDEQQRQAVRNLMHKNSYLFAKE